MDSDCSLRTSSNPLALVPRTTSYLKPLPPHLPDGGPPVRGQLVLNHLLQLSQHLHLIHREYIVRGGGGGGGGVSNWQPPPLPWTVEYSSKPLSFRLFAKYVLLFSFTKEDQISLLFRSKKVKKVKKLSTFGAQLF